MRRETSTLLGTLSELRGLQDVAAEIAATRATLGRRTAEEQAVASETVLQGLRSGWAAAIGAGFDLDASRRWAAAWSRQQSAIEQHHEAVAAARDAERAARSAWLGTQARLDTARTRHREARRDESRRRDEARDHEAAERHAYRTIKV